MNAQVKEPASRIELELAEAGDIAAEESRRLAMSLEPKPIHAPATIDQPHAAMADPFPPGAPMPGSGSVIEQIVWLIQHGISAAQVDSYMALQREQDGERARRAYLAAMAAFKREDIADIVKNANVNYATKGDDGRKGSGDDVDYMHETLDAVVFAVLKPMAKHGLTHKWVPTQDKGGPTPGLITLRCVVTHEQGHAEFVELFASPDKSGKKNDIQAIKSTMSYLERITLLAITGLAAKGMDNDGRGNARPGQPPGGDEPEFITAEQLAELDSLILDVDADRAAFTKVCRVSDLAKLPAAKFNDAKLKLEAKRADANRQ